MEFDITARRIDEHGSVASTKDAVLTLDTDLAGRRDAFNPAELLLAAVAACMYTITVDTDETEQRIQLLHVNVRKYGTVFNTVAPGTDLAGEMRRGVV